MNSIRVPDGTIEYRDTGGDGPTLVFVHGLIVSGTLWDDVVARVRSWARCVVLDLPLGSHRIPLENDAARSPRGVANLIADVLEALDLRDVILVGNDTGGAICQLVVTTRPERVGGLVLTPCDAFENFLPPMFRPLQYLARIPGAVGVAIQPARITALHNTTLLYGTLVVRPIPREKTAAWLRPALADRGVRRDLTRFMARIDSRATLDAAAKLPAFGKPAMVVWTPADRVFPPDHGPRLAALLGARLEVVDDSRAFLPLDRPERLAELLEELVG